MTQRPDESAINGVLRGVIDPELGSNIVELGMVKGVTVSPDGDVVLAVALTTAGCPLRGQIQRDAKTRVESMPGISKVTIEWSVLDAEERSAAMAVARRNAADRAPQTAIPATARVLAIASGKGGVGKSSVTANLAAALAMAGHNVGVIDADIWGFSIPRMLGLDGRLAASKSDDKAVITPLTRQMGPGRLDVVSMGFLVEDEDSALLWRGLMLNRAVQHFLEDVDWSDDLDYVLIDMPPGTGDVAMGLARMIPRAEMIVVTTPATGAQKVASRAVSMARKSYLRVAGVIENMSYFEAPDGSRHDLFGRGGGEALAADSGVELIGRIPIEPEVSAGGDAGEPVVADERHVDSAAARSFRQIAGRILDDVAPPIEMESCTARMLDLVEAALSEHDAKGDDDVESATT